MLWVVVFAVAGAVTTLALACATPFAALAAIAATRLPARAGFALVALSWASSQVIGFCVLDYPRDPTTLAWGVALLSAALAAMAAARWGDRATAASHGAVRLATAFGTGFVAYKATLAVWSLVLGGLHTALSPYWTIRQFGQEALMLAGLVALYHALVAIGLPAAGRTRAA
ncbi:hypothetical protein [Sphingomonas sp.]|uniref:hypothetical protein n=1 Tax=Sphingomonas sp. TaxID=28214 RepID=UPI002DD6193D|nr:hypothetical protein [Sphingomonas sp.]